MCSAMQEIIDEEMRKTVRLAYLNGNTPDNICKFVLSIPKDEIEEICKQVDNEKQKASQ